MRIRAVLSAGAGLLLLGGTAAMAGEARIYPYHTSHNFCPAGLQPVTIDGTICCGDPNQTMSYQAMMSHPVKKKKHHRVKASVVDCPIGTKGCSFN